MGDPEVADVNPLTDHTVSILGKKIGTTRVTAYGEGKKAVGIFDVEVAYDVSRLDAEIARVAGGSIKVSSVNGHIMLSGQAPDAVTLDKAVQIARQFVPDVINTVQVMQPQQIMLEVRFIEVVAFGKPPVRRAVEHVRQRRGSQYRQPGPGSAADNRRGRFFPAAGLCQQRYRRGSVLPTGLPARRCRRRLLPACCRAPRRSVSWSANCLAAKTRSTCRSTRSNRKASPAAWRNPIWWPCPATPRASLPAGNFRSRRPAALGTVAFAYQPYGVGLSFTPTVLRDGLINLVIKPEVSQIDPTNTVTVARHLGPGTHHPQGLDHARIARRPELHARRLVAEPEHDGAGPVAMGRRRAGARRSVPLQPVPEERDRSGDPGDAAHRASAGAERSRSTRRSIDRCRQTTSTFS